MWGNEMIKKLEPVDQILADFGIADPVQYLEDVQNGIPDGFSKDPTVDIVGNIELAREKAAADALVE